MLGVRRRERKRAVENGLEMLIFSGGGGPKSSPRQTAPPPPRKITLSQLSQASTALQMAPCAANGMRLLDSREERQLRGYRLLCSSTSHSPDSRIVWSSFDLSSQSVEGDWD